MVLDWVEETYTGASCTGSDGDSNRTLTISNTNTTNNNYFLVEAGGLTLGLTTEYTVVHASSSTVITFLNPLFNTSAIKVKYYQTVSSVQERWNIEQGTGSDCSGSSGDSDRVYTLSNSYLTSSGGLQVMASGLTLKNTNEYSVTHNAESSTVTFTNPLFDDMTISIKYYEKESGYTNKYSKIRDDFQNVVIEHSQLSTLIRRTTTTDTMGAAVSDTEEYYNLFASIQDITRKDRQLHEMGLAIPGNSKAFFFHSYPDSVTGNGTLIVQPGDIIVYASRQWRVEQIIAQRSMQGQEIFRTALIKKIDLD